MSKAVRCTRILISTLYSVHMLHSSKNFRKVAPMATPSFSKPAL